MILSPAQPSDMLAAHHGARRRTIAKAPAARLRNVEPILSLGELEFVHFRGRAYGVPPLPWKAGQQLLDARLRAIDATAVLARDPRDPEMRTAYFKALAKISALLWRNCHPTGKVRRFLRRLGLLQNPWANASEWELLEHADFFVSRRMKSGVPARPASLTRATSSTT